MLLVLGLFYYIYFYLHFSLLFKYRVLFKIWILIACKASLLRCFIKTQTNRKLNPLILIFHFCHPVKTTIHPVVYCCLYFPHSPPTPAVPTFYVENDALSLGPQNSRSEASALCYWSVWNNDSKTAAFPVTHYLWSNSPSFTKFLGGGRQRQPRLS